MKEYKKALLFEEVMLALIHLGHAQPWVCTHARGSLYPWVPGPKDPFGLGGLKSVSARPPGPNLNQVQVPLWVRTFTQGYQDPRSPGK